MTENATSLTSSADADGPVVGRHLEDVGLDDLAVPQVRLQPHLVPRLRTQVAQQHRCIGKKKERYRINLLIGKPLDWRRRYSVVYLVTEHSLLVDINNVNKSFSLPYEPPCTRQ